MQQPLADVRYIKIPTAPVVPPKIIAVHPPKANPVHPVRLAPAPTRLKTGKRSLKQATDAALVVPTKGRFIEGRQIYPFRDGASYRAITVPLRLIDIQLEAGETIQSTLAGDTLNWRLETAQSGPSAAPITHVFIKPITDDVATNLVITTDRRTYNIDLTVAKEGEPFHHGIAWTYPEKAMQIAKANAQSKHTIGRSNNTSDDIPGNYTVVGGPNASAEATLAHLNFNWTIENAAEQHWLPTKIYDDGRRVIIRFPPDLARRKMPVLSLLTDDNQIEIVNYIQTGTTIIVPYLFDRAMLSAGNNPNDVIFLAKTGIWTPPPKVAQ